MQKLKTISLLAVLIASICCSSAPSRPAEEIGSESRIEKVKLGDSEKRVAEIWGTPQYEVEKYPSATFRVLTYLNKDGRPDSFFTLDQSADRVVGKSLWIYPGSSFYDLENASKTHFNGVAMKSYVPCRTRSDRDEILVNQELGLYIAKEKEHAVLVSWVTPELARLRIDLLFNTCPGLQKEHR